MGLERHQVHDLKVWQPYPGCDGHDDDDNDDDDNDDDDNDDDDNDDDDQEEEEKTSHLGKILMFTAIISVLDVMLLESLL